MIYKLMDNHIEIFFGLDFLAIALGFLGAIWPTLLLISIFLMAALWAISYCYARRVRKLCRI